MIVEEISLTTGDLFDKLEFIGRTLKNTEEPFGGIQLIISGEFHQLPPELLLLPPQRQIFYDFHEGPPWRSKPPWLHQPPNFPQKLSRQISLYGKYLFIASCEAVELANTLRLTHTLPFFVIFRADFNFAAQEKAVTCSNETQNGGHSFSSCSGLSTILYQGEQRRRSGENTINLLN